MAAQEGEERILILFADVHYYFNAPTPRPLSHRFDKGEASIPFLQIEPIS